MVYQLSYWSAGWKLTLALFPPTSPLPRTPKNAMRRYIAALARRIGYSALTNRSTFLFERAMEEGRFRYGRKARLVAGSCLAIALREAQKGETIKDIAVRISNF